MSPRCTSRPLKMHCRFSMQIRIGPLTSHVNSDADELFFACVRLRTALMRARSSSIEKGLQT